MADMTDIPDPRAARRADYERALARQPDGMSRRRFLELLGASLALAGAAACALPREKIVPYVRQPEGITPGTPLFFASAHLLGGYAQGVLVESHEGRPTKVEGNPEHPASLGATDVFAQASVLTLYTPARSQAVTAQGQISTWAAFAAALRRTLDDLRASGGDGLRFLSEASTSPTLAAQRQQVLATFPRAQWHTWEPVSRDAAHAGTQLLFGAPLEPRYAFDKADVVLLLDADPFAWDPGRVRYIHDVAARRRPEQGPMSRLYAVESTLTTTGASADHRLPLPSGAVEPFAFALARALGVDVGAGPPAPAPVGVPTGWLPALADDLRAHGRTALVVPGDVQPPAVHALAHAMNAALGSIGTTVDYVDPLEIDATDHTASLRALVGDMDAGRVQALLVLGGNPAYTAPADIPFTTSLAKVGFRAHLGLFEDETAALCQWHVPELHPLEAWSDARAFDGTVTIQQPLIAPLYPGKSAHEMLAAVVGQPEQTSHDVVKGYWQSQRGGTSADLDSFWQAALHDGLLPQSALPARRVAVRPDWTAGLTPAPPLGPGSLELTFRPDPSLYDGRFAANGWLLELPRPLTKLTWDNAAYVSPATARRLGVQHQDVVELRAGGHAVRAPMWVLPGQADESVAITLGYGRQRGAGAGTGVGFNAYAVRTSSAPWFAGGLEVVPTGEQHAFAATQGHYTMEGRDLVRSVTAGELQQHGAAAVGAAQPSGSLYPPYQYPGSAWGMVIDQSACVGCNACIVACQAENNIPVVGREQVAQGREMHWLRLDTYLDGDQADPRVLQQLVPCMHCENAPCELVCPVGATVHSADGLNDMVYNRCVGTRYCSNNCPYKVRHFNFLQYADYDTSVLKLLRNPDVTVRSRGVMEKCTYCVQRIRGAEIQATKENRPIRDGEVLTACQAACPAGAIVFGNLNDPGSQVAAQRAGARNYALLAELNTRPRTTYLATVRNPNPALEPT